MAEQISGYIDYTERMRTDDLEPVFLHKKRFLPKAFDLSYYNWYAFTVILSCQQYNAMFPQFYKTEKSIRTTCGVSNTVGLPSHKLYIWGKL